MTKIIVIVMLMAMVAASGCGSTVLMVADDGNHGVVDSGNYTGDTYNGEKPPTGYVEEPYLAKYVLQEDKTYKRYPRCECGELIKDALYVAETVGGTVYTDRPPYYSADGSWSFTDACFVLPDGCEMLICGNESVYKVLGMLGNATVVSRGDEDD